MATLITLRTEIQDHVGPLLKQKNYYHAVEEAYKLVCCRLKELTGEEQAHKAFKEGNLEKFFGRCPGGGERDFLEGVKFLHMAIQNWRNDKVHTPKKPLDKNRALHYIALTSLAYDLISHSVKR